MERTGPAESSGGPVHREVGRALAAQSRVVVWYVVVWVAVLFFLKYQRGQDILIGKWHAASDTMIRYVVWVKRLRLVMLSGWIFVCVRKHQTGDLGLVRTDFVDLKTLGIFVQAPGSCTERT